MVEVLAAARPPKSGAGDGLRSYKLSLWPSSAAVSKAGSGATAGVLALEFVVGRGSL